MICSGLNIVGFNWITSPAATEPGSIVMTSVASDCALTPDCFRSSMEADIGQGLVPLYLSATVVSTAPGAVDRLLELGRITNEYGVWYHVDAACAGSSGICPEFRHYFDGVEEMANSFSMNPHKWFLTNMDSCCLWVKSPSSLVDSLCSNAEQGQ